MGFLDRILSFVGSREAAPADLRGPLGLAVGDFVEYYQDKFAVVGVRRLQGEGPAVWHYCLREETGPTAVLCFEEGPEPALWLQRAVDAEIPWEQDVLDGIADEPFKLTTRGRATVRSVGDAGASPSVSYREFEDSSGDRTVVLEDWGGRREVRVGELVHEAELTLHRSGQEASLESRIDPEDSGAPSEAARGSRDAAALALIGRSELDGSFVPQDRPEETEVAAFSDDRWTEDDEPDQEDSAAPAALTVVDTEEDEWIAAARYLRENGVPIDAGQCEAPAAESPAADVPEVAAVAVGPEPTADLSA